MGSLLVMSVACGQDTAGPRGDLVPASYPSDTVAVRVRNDGSTIAGPTPWPLIVTIYGDGRVVSQRPHPETFPLPALPDLQIQWISTTDVHLLAQRSVDAGVAAQPDLGRAWRSDSNTVRFTVSTKDGPRSLDVYDLSYIPPVDGRHGLTARQLAARATLRDLYSALTDLPAALGPDAVGGAAAYVPEAVAVIASAWEAPRTDTGASPELAWPGPALPGQALATRPDAGCVVVTGAAAATVIAAGEKATSSTPWTSGGRRWTVRLRPLWPDEKPCPPEPGVRTCGPCPE
jgi:hypothetical protein